MRQSTKDQKAIEHFTEMKTKALISTEGRPAEGTTIGGLQYWVQPEPEYNGDQRIGWKFYILRNIPTSTRGHKIHTLTRRGSIRAYLVITETGIIQAAGRSAEKAAEEACREIFMTATTGQAAIDLVQQEGLEMVFARLRGLRSVNEIEATSEWELIEAL